MTQPVYDVIAIGNAIVDVMAPCDDATIERLGMTAEGVRRHDARGDVKLLVEAVRQMWCRLSPDFSTCPVPVKSGVIPLL